MNVFGSLDYQQVATANQYGLLEAKLQNAERTYSWMCESERMFVYGLLKHFRPSKIVEIGVFAGGGSVVILDGSHLLPGELLDFLLILPYTTENCLFILYDVNVGPYNDMRLSDPPANPVPLCCRLLMSCVVADKTYPRLLPESLFTQEPFTFLLRNLPEAKLPNIGAFMRNERTGTDEALYELFSLLLMRWSRQLSYVNVVNISRHLRRFYPEKLASIFDMAYCYNVQLQYASTIRKNSYSSDQAENPEKP